MSGLSSRLGRLLRIDAGSAFAFALVLMIIFVAVWHAVDFSHDFDPEFPGLQRDHHSPYAPFAYRIAEPGDTLDLVSLYLSAFGLGLMLLCRLNRVDLRVSEGSGNLTPLFLGLCLAGFWIGSAPYPAADGWHGLSIQSISRSDTPFEIRATLLGAAAVLLSLICIPLVIHGKKLFKSASSAWRVLSVLCGLCFLWRIAGSPDPEPWGYWPRWAMVVGMIIIDTALMSRIVSAESSPRIGFTARLRPAVLVGSLILVVIQTGFYLHWLHWPIPRLKVIVPGQLYASAMPPPDGLALAHSRHGFKTIINLFNEDTPQRHRDYPNEVAFAKENGIRYIRADGTSQGVDFVRKTLEAARDPENWPVLVHCHGNMDRTPAWVGIYRFIDMGWSMREVLAAIERHRGYRPKGGVTVLYNDVIPALAPERWHDDTVARKLADYGQAYMKSAAQAEIARNSTDREQK